MLDCEFGLTKMYALIEVFINQVQKFIVSL